MTDNIGIVYLAGGCFWGVEHLMRKIPGVVSVLSGYANGTVSHPSYERVCQGDTGARETVEVRYDGDKTNLETILSVYFQIIDPTVRNRQGHDIGSQYQTGIYYVDERTYRLARYLMEQDQQKYAEYYVELKPLQSFYPAEEYHQEYLLKHPNGYCHIPPALMKRAVVWQAPLDEALWNHESLL